MFKFRRKDKDKDQQVKDEAKTEPAQTADSEAPTSASEPPAAEPTASPAAEADKPKRSLRDRMRRTRQAFTEQLADMFMVPREIDDALLEEIETMLLTADIGVEATTDIVDKLSQSVQRQELSNAQALVQSLQNALTELLDPVEQPLVIDTSKKPYVILVVGVNGVGKTTTIGKLAHRFKDDGHKVMLAAGDTFRAAAVDQLQQWGARNEVPVVAQPTGADSASVIYDAIEAAKARDVDVLIADTAGRLHTQNNLMAELQKIKRVMNKLDASYPHESLLVLDGGTGQNALAQARQFDEAVPVSGLVVTKLDGTAKGGLVLALSRVFPRPIRFIGVGEQREDLREFKAREFAEALIPDDFAR